MSDPNVDRIRDAISRVEKMLNAEFAVSLWTDPPSPPAVKSNTDAAPDSSSQPAILNTGSENARAANTLARELVADESILAASTLALAEELAERLATANQTSAIALLAHARKIAGQLHDEERREAAALLSLATHVASELQAQARCAADALVVAAESRDRRHSPSD
jgi:hypothetical protein